MGRPPPRHGPGRARPARAVAASRFAFPTGTAYEYSNLGYALLGDLSARTTELLLEPLGLTRTTWTQPDHDDWAPPRRPTRARPRRVRRDGRPVVEPRGPGDVGGVPRRRLPAARRPRRRPAAAIVAPRDAAGAPGQAARGRRLRLRAAGASTTTRFGTIVEPLGWAARLRLEHALAAGAPRRRDRPRQLDVRPDGPRSTRRMLDVLDDHGLVPAPSSPVSPALQRAAEDLVALLSDWDDAAADGLFADNVALDQPYAERAAAAASSCHARAVARRTGRRGVGDRRHGTVAGARDVRDRAPAGADRAVASSTTRSFSNVGR